MDITGTPLSSDQHPLKLIIDGSCTSDCKTKSWWGQALRYVWRRRKHKIESREQFTKDADQARLWIVSPSL